MEQKMNNSKQFVIFKLGEEEYGLDIQKVTTIERIMNIARVPKTPKFIKGVINLRGEIVPIICMRDRFDLSESIYTEDTRIMVIKNDEVSAGLIVDSVSEVLQLDSSNIESIVNMNSENLNDCIQAIGKQNERIITILDLEKLVII